MVSFSYGSAKIGLYLGLWNYYGKTVKEIADLVG